MQSVPFEHSVAKPACADTPSGIACCGELHWGAHFCHLYETRDDLIDTLVPFFAAGLANNEYCLWVTSDPLDATDATLVLAERVPNLQRYLDSGQIRIVDHADWYTRVGEVNADSVIQAWIDAEQQALADGFSGLRITGNVTFIKSREDWRKFERYEARVSEAFAGHRIVALCSYHLSMTSGNDILDVVRNHQFAVARREGKWDMIEDAAIKLAKHELHQANLELERRVEERTAELRNALATVEAQKRELEIALRMRDDSQRQVETELADARLVRDISAALIIEDDVDGLYQKLVDAAALVMHSDFASMQRFDAERGALQLLATRGFNAEAEAFWQWVHPGRPSICGMALYQGGRAIVPDFEACEFMKGSDDLAACRAGGVRAAQSTPLLSRNGQLVGMISTHWKQIHEPRERDLRMLDILARQAADLIERNTAAEALRAQTRQLLEADRRKDEFLATLAHELRNPLAPIRTGLTVLRRGAPENAPRVLAIMERQLAHMVHLIDDLLDVSRISRGKLTLKRKKVTLSAVVETAIETSRPLLTAGGHEFTVTLPDHAVWLDVDMTRAAQVVSNVLNNAAKYTPQGGRIALIAKHVGDQVQIRVTDTGIGIPAPMLPRIFDLFMQVDQSIERTQGGLGVGLSLAKQLIEMHGGAIEAESEGPGQGAAFTIQLPVAEALSAAPARGAVQAGVAAGNGIRVLIVDDNADAAETHALLLNVLGYTTRVVCEALKALDAALEFKPDVVLLDLGMPHLHGFDLARQLRAQSALEGVALIALSGWGNEEHRARSRSVGIDHHLTKPVSLDELQRVLVQVSQRE